MDTEVIWVGPETKYFCNWGWTGNSLICRSGQIIPFRLRSLSYGGRVAVRATGTRPACPPQLKSKGGRRKRPFSESVVGAWLGIGKFFALSEVRPTARRFILLAIPRASEKALRPNAANGTLMR
jgi:hypothetical protein